MDCGSSVRFCQQYWYLRRIRWGKRKHIHTTSSPSRPKRRTFFISHIAFVLFSHFIWRSLKFSCHFYGICVRRVRRAMAAKLATNWTHNKYRYSSLCTHFRGSANKTKETHCMSINGHVSSQNASEWMNVRCRLAIETSTFLNTHVYGHCLLPFRSINFFMVFARIEIARAHTSKFCTEIIVFSIWVCDDWQLHILFVPWD